MMLSKVQKNTALLLLVLMVLLLVILGAVIVEKVKGSEMGENQPSEVSGAVYKIDMTPYADAVFTKDSSFLILVNPSNNIGTTVPDKIVDSKTIDAYSFSSYQIHETALAALTAMCLEAEADGVYGIDLTSAYRSYEKQNTLFNGYCDREMRNNAALTREEAERIVATYSCRPGTSEHQTGLAVDLRLRGDNETLLEESFAETQAGKWLSENCTRFGFVLRFPADKTEITGIQFEPWHFRFVGYDAAQKMKELGMCLEEYSAYLDSFSHE